MPAATARDVLNGLDPASVWNFFAELTAVPRPSKQEDKARQWVLAIAAKKGWKHRDDAVGNIVIDVPASPGCESAAPLALQSHLDMVCEKNADVTFDFDRDPLKLRIVGDEVRATGTTLGADNGIGVCAMLAVATDPAVRHGPLELLFTIDEETGLTGATAISPELLRARRLINLDSEEDDILYIGCAGGRTTTLRASLPLLPAGADEVGVTLVVDGLKGGHSGADIHLCRGNANKLLARTLARCAAPLRIVTLSGGNKHNAIPRECRATLLVARRAGRVARRRGRVAGRGEATAGGHRPRRPHHRRRRGRRAGALGRRLAPANRPDRRPARRRAGHQPRHHRAGRNLEQRRRGHGRTGGRQSRRDAGRVVAQLVGATPDGDS
ncbi:MAG: M20/M25/M40 family metallo-hydrolase [Phycisphaerae bacterium]